MSDGSDEFDLQIVYSGRSVIAEEIRVDAGRTGLPEVRFEHVRDWEQIIERPDVTVGYGTLVDAMATFSGEAGELGSLLERAIRLLDCASAARRSAVILPSVSGTSPGLVEAVEQAGFDVSVAANLEMLGGVAPAIILLNIAGFGSPDTWPQRFVATLGDKMAGDFALVPTVVIDPPITAWDKVGGFTKGVDAYFIWPGEAAALVRLLQRVMGLIVGRDQAPAERNHRS